MVKNRKEREYEKEEGMRNCCGRCGDQVRKVEGKCEENHYFGKMKCLYHKTVVAFQCLCHQDLF